jgi:tetratricopeptide (TPR) repeat protein
LAEAARLVSLRQFREAHALCLAALERAPDSAEAYFLLAMIAAEHENFVRAAQLLDQAIAINADDARFHAQRGKCLARLRQLGPAREAGERAAALNPQDSLTLDTIGVVYSHAGFHDRAIAYFERAAEGDTDNPNLLHNLGVSRQICGDFAGAERAFRAELKLRPSARRPYSAIVNLSKQTREQNFIAELKEQFAAAEDANARLQIGHALAKSFEDLGEYAEAMHWLGEAKAAKRASFGDVMEEYRAAFAAAEESAGAPRVTGGHDSAEPIFIVGMPRTGTTLVDRIISSHPDVMSAGELGNFSALAHGLLGLKELDDARMLARAGDLDLARLGKAYVDSTRPLTGKTAHFIDKMPVNFLNAALILKALPNARVVCLRRHPMDACLSNYRQIFGADVAPYRYTLSLEDTAGYYKLFDALAARWRDVLPGDRYLEVSYEGLVADLEPQARRLVDFCDLGWDDACLAFHENAAPVATASSVQVRSPIYSSSVGRWRRYGEAVTPLRAALEAAGVIVD